MAVDVNTKEKDLVALVTLTITIILVIALVRWLLAISGSSGPQASRGINSYPVSAQERPKENNSVSNEYQEIIQRSKSQYRDFMEQQKNLAK